MNTIMQSIKNSFFYFTTLCFLVIVSCDENNVIDDVQQTAALKNVSITYDSLVYEITLPEGALGDKTFDELYALDSSKYSDPANYSIDFSAHMLADNTKDNAKDAKFDGMVIDIIMDTIQSSPLQTVASGFEVAKNTTLPVEAVTQINLKTHRLSGLYIFKQTVDGNDLETTLSPMLNYKIGIKEGTINIPDMHKSIPTRASEETKAFLRDLLNSGVLSGE